MADLLEMHHLMQQNGSNVSSDDVFVFPASFAQQRLWFLDKLEPEGNAYNVRFGVQLSGQLHVGALEQSFQELIRRHEILRTTLSEDENVKPVQVVAASQEFALQLTDLRSVPSDVRDEEVRRRVVKLARLPFDLRPLIGCLSNQRLGRVGNTVEPPYCKAAEESVNEHKE